MPDKESEQDHDHEKGKENANGNPGHICASLQELGGVQAGLDDLTPQFSPVFLRNIRYAVTRYIGERPDILQKTHIFLEFLNTGGVSVGVDPDGPQVLNGIPPVVFRDNIQDMPGKVPDNLQEGGIVDIGGDPDEPPVRRNNPTGCILSLRYRARSP